MSRTDTDATVAQVNELGGSVMAEPFDIPEVGRIAIALDPAFAAFGVITNAQPPSYEEGLVGILGLRELIDRQP